MKFIEVTEMGRKYYINVNKILFVDKINEYKSLARIILDCRNDKNELIQFSVEEPYDSIINMIYFSDE